MEETKLELEIMPGNAICHPCNKVFNFLACDQKCPLCGGKDFELISGREFNIKEIVAC